MNTMINRYRARRSAARQRYAIERAIAQSPSSAVRAELSAMTNR